MNKPRPRYLITIGAGLSGISVKMGPSILLLLYQIRDKENMNRIIKFSDVLLVFR